MLSRQVYTTSITKEILILSFPMNNLSFLEQMMHLILIETVPNV